MTSHLHGEKRVARVVFQFKVAPSGKAALLGLGDRVAARSTKDRHLNRPTEAEIGRAMAAEVMRDPNIQGRIVARLIAEQEA